MTRGRKPKVDPLHGLNFWRDGVALGRPYTMRDAEKEFGKSSADLMSWRIPGALCRCSVILQPSGELDSKVMEAGG